jgi:hypothetical protein
MHFHWNFGIHLISSVTDRAMETLTDACGSRLFPVYLSLTCHCLTPREVSLSTCLLIKINCAAFPATMSGRHLHCFRTLRSITVRCTSRGHNQHSPYGLQPANSLAGLSCTIPYSVGTTGIVSEASPSRLLY